MFTGIQTYTEIQLNLLAHTHTHEQARKFTLSQKLLKYKLDS